MGAVKRMAEEVAERMEIDDISDPRVLAEVDRLLSLMDRRLVVLESHPNSGGCWVGMMGTEREVLQYLKKAFDEGNIDYVLWIVELREKAEDETTQWIEFEDCEPIRIVFRPSKAKGGPTPPLPGLEKRLAGIEADAYGQHRSVWSLLQAMTDEEVALTFSDVLEGMLQSGRELPEAGKTKCGT